MTDDHAEPLGADVPEELRDAFEGLRQRYGDLPPPAPGGAVAAFLDGGRTPRRSSHRSDRRSGPSRA
jgi:hypothetical protein